MFLKPKLNSISIQASYANNERHYGFYIDGDIAKLPGGGRRGATVLCELIPGAKIFESQPQTTQSFSGELAEDPNPHQGRR